MSQIRYVNFGDTLTANLIGTITSTVAAPGRYVGYGVVVIDPQTVEMQDPNNPTGRVGYLVLPDGVILSETGPVRITFPVFPNAATTYTIVAIHDTAQLFGGAAAFYEVRVGKVQQSTLTNGTVIAYVFYPGNGVGLASYMIVQPPYARFDSIPSIVSQQPRVEVSPFSDSIVTVATHHTVTNQLGTLSPLQSGSSWPQTVIEANSSTVGTETTIFRFLYPLGARPTRLDLTALIDIGCNVQVLVADVLDTFVSTTPATALGPLNPTAWTTYSVQIPPYTNSLPPIENGTWTVGKYARIEVRVNQPLLTTCRISSLIVHFDPTLLV